MNNSFITPKVFLRMPKTELKEWLSRPFPSMGLDDYLGTCMINYLFVIYAIKRKGKR